LYKGKKEKADCELNLRFVFALLLGGGGRRICCLKWRQCVELPLPLLTLLACPLAPQTLTPLYRYKAPPFTYRQEHPRRTNRRRDPLSSSNASMARGLSLSIIGFAAASSIVQAFLLPSLPTTTRSSRALDSQRQGLSGDVIRPYEGSAGGGGDARQQFAGECV